MKTSLLFLLLLTVLLPLEVHSQQEIKGNYKIYLNKNGKSNNSKVPIVLEQELVKDEVLYVFDGKEAIKKTKSFKEINPSYSFKSLNTDKRSINVDLEQKENKLIITPKGELLKKFKSAQIGTKQRLVIDITKGVKITRKATKFSAMTIPFKIYLAHRADELVYFTNNIETNVNIALTIGKSKELYSYKVGRGPQLTNTFNYFFFAGLNKLSLTKKNTDSVIDGDNILTASTGVGVQVGYGKVGFSLLTGFDAPSSAIGKNWVFRYEPWIGLGIGYSIFK